MQQLGLTLKQLISKSNVTFHQAYQNLNVSEIRVVEVRKKVM